MATTRSTRRVRADRRRRRRLAQVDHDLTAADWTALRDAWAGCAYCGDATGDLQRDCVLPISRGGRYTVGNVVPACRACNASKCNAEVTSWMRRKRLDERAFLVRHAQVLALLVAAPTGPATTGPAPTGPTPGPAPTGPAPVEPVDVAVPAEPGERVAP